MSSIQKLIVKIVDTYLTLNLETDKLNKLLVPDEVFEFFLKWLDMRGFTYDHEMGQTVHCLEKLKKNMLKLLKGFARVSGFREMSF